MDKKIFGMALLVLAAAIFALPPTPAPETPMGFYGIINATGGTAIGQTLLVALGNSTESALVNETGVYSCAPDMCNYYVTIGRVPGDTVSTGIEFKVGTCSLVNVTFSSGSVERRDMTIPAGCLLPLCGDGACNGAESCSICAADCGACAPPASSGGGGNNNNGGGGGGAPRPNPQNPPVEELQEELPPSELPVTPPTETTTPPAAPIVTAPANTGANAPKTANVEATPPATPARGLGDTLAAMIGDFGTNPLFLGITGFGLLGLLLLMVVIGGWFFFVAGRKKKKQEKQ